MCIFKKSTWIALQSHIFILQLYSLLLLLMLSRFSCVWLCETPWMAAHQASPSLGFSRQEHWSGLPFPSPLYSLGQDKSLCFNFIFQYMRMRIEPMLMDYCKDKVNHDWLKESIQAYFVVIIISVMYICLLSISLSRLSASGRKNSWHIYFGVTTVKIEASMYTYSKLCLVK